MYCSGIIRTGDGNDEDYASNTTRSRDSLKTSRDSEGRKMKVIKGISKRFLL